MLLLILQVQLIQIQLAGVTCMIASAVEFSAIPFTTTWAYGSTRFMMRYVERYIVVELPSNLDGYT